MAEKRIVESLCKSCHGGCRVQITVEDGVVTHIEGIQEWITRGTMCAKGIASRQHINNPNRIKYPIKRTGERGEGKWQRITWNEALDTIADKINESIKKYGSNAVAIAQGTERGYNRYVNRLVSSIGSGQRISPGYFCYRPRLLASGITVGGRLYCDYHGWGGEFPKTQISWAKQLEITNADGEMGVWFLDSLEKAKNLILVDPRATAISTRANLWLQLRPGTDAALALGMMHIIINEGIYDKEFVSNWTYGFDELRERVQEYPPEKVAEITWVPKEKIIQAARMFALDTPGCIQIGEPVEASINSTQNVRALLCLAAITGNIERPGSMVNWVPTAAGPMEDLALEVKISDESKRTLAGADKFRLGSLAGCHPNTIFNELREGNSLVKVIHWQGSNALTCYANTKNLLDGLLNLEFMSSADLFMSPTVEYSDIVLPVAHWLETDDIYDMHPRFFIAAVNKAVEPPGEAWPDNRIINELGKRVAPEYWFDDVEQLLDYQLRKASIKWKEFKEMGFLARMGKDQPYYKYKTDYWKEGGGFATPTGKVELYSTVLDDLGYNPLPYYAEPNESPYSTPELAKEYPLILSTGGRLTYYFHSQYRQIPWLREIQPYPLVQIHPRIAGELGIKEGDWVWIETPRGRIKQKAKLFTGIDPRVVIAQASWWYPEKPAPEHGIFESNANVLTSDDAFDPAIGSTNFRALLCKVYKVEEDENE
ncbi:molybdopterin-dependent oxidoreductase [Chloroflexota bacterium]